MCPPPGSISLLAGINVVLRDVQTRHVLLTADLQMWLSAAETFEEASENDVAGGRTVLPVSAIVRWLSPVVLF
jgi:hypothetical protein